MDPVSAGASVVTFLTLAYSVSKTVRDLLSAISDGPQILGRLIHEIAQLESILQRLQQVSFGSASPADTAELARLAQKCADDLTGFNSKLQRLNVSAADSRGGRLWRRLKSCFTEKDLEQMRELIQTHVLMLTVRLNLLQTEQLSFSQTQSTEILGLLQQLKQDVAALQPSSSSSAASENPTASDSMEIDEEVLRTSSALEASITRLMRLLEKKACAVESDDAEELIEDFESLLKAIQAGTAVPPEAPKGIDYADNDADDDVSKELKLVRNIVLSAPSMKINQNGPLGFLAALPEGTVIHQERKRKIIDIGDGVVTITSNKRRCKFRPQSQAGAENEGISKREFIAKLVFKPRNADAMLTVSVNQGQVLFDSFTSMLPRITASNILPTGSLVFELAFTGRIQDLKKLVAEGKASLHDHDSHGWSLLHYASNHPSMCKFLIQQGLDVNGIAQTGEGAGTPLSTARALMQATTPETIGALLAAGADPTLSVGGLTALEAVAMESETSSLADGVLREMLYTSPFVRYADPETRRRHNVLGLACLPRGSPRELEVVDPDRQIQKLKWILDSGYDVNAVGDKGRTCLQGFFAYVSFDDAIFDLNWRHVLIYLVKQGINIRAIDSWNRSVSDLAYRKRICAVCMSSRSSLLGDFWDVILDSCGYDILEFRKACPRIARYTDNYTRQDFELLWQGREDQCPYWDDIAWPENPLDNNREDWVYIDANRKICEKCIKCATRGDKKAFGDGFCGKCGYCLYVVDCSCHKDGHPYHKPGCPVPRRVLWDPDRKRFYSLEEALHHQQHSGEDYDDEQDASETSSGSVTDQDHHELSPDTGEHTLRNRQIPFLSNQGTGNGAKLETFVASESEQQGELFENPWEEPQIRSCGNERCSPVFGMETRWME
ncbi:hypothetical protein ACJZ2D_007678 [Fusarium nematophilum]